MNFRSFDAYVDAHVHQLLHQLTDFCRIPSISAENGPAIGQAAGRVQELCQEAGIAVQTFHQAASPPILVGLTGTGLRCLMIYNHYDVQPPDPLEEWSSPPFEPQVRDGKLYARGVADNKADLVARLAALRAYQETLGPLPLQVLTIFEGEEEVGSPHLFEFANSHAEILQAADGCLWEYGYKNTEDRPVVNLGVKGIVALELHARTAQSDAHSASGGLFPNAAWRLVEALNTLRAPDGRVLIDGLMDHVRVPEAREEALLSQIPYDATAVRRAAGLRGPLLGNLEGQSALRRLLLEPTCTINGMVAGYTGPGSKTVIPCQAMAKLDIRLVPGLTPAIAVRLLREHLARRGFDDVEVVDLKDGLQPMRTDPDAEIVRAVVDAVADVAGQPPLVYPSSAGSGPMYELCGVHGIPVASCGVAWYGSRAHAPNESIRIADFVEGIKVVGRLIHRFAQLKAEPATGL